MQRIGSAAKIESFQSSHDGNQKKKPKDQQPNDIRGRLFDAAPLKRLLDAGTIGKCIELANSKDSHNNSLDDVAKRPAHYDESHGKQKIRQKHSYLSHKRIPKTGYGYHGIHNFPPSQRLFG